MGRRRSVDISQATRGRRVCLGGADRGDWRTLVIGTWEVFRPFLLKKTEVRHQSYDKVVLIKDHRRYAVSRKINPKPEL